MRRVISSSRLWLEALRAEAKKELARLAHAHPRAQLLMTIPGVNYTTAVGILGAVQTFMLRSMRDAAVLRAP